jgi:hypothetical protein
MINDTTSRIICIVAVVLNGPFPTEQFRDCLLSFFDEQNYGLQRRMTTLTQIYTPLEEAIAPFQQTLRDLRCSLPYLHVVRQG